MIGAEAIRVLALALPEAVEADHHGIASFRVAGRIFCTLRDERPRLMVKLDPADQHNFVEGYADAIQPVPGYWGRKGSTWVDTTAVDQALVASLLRLAWTRVAPARLGRAP